MACGVGSTGAQLINHAQCECQHDQSSACRLNHRLPEQDPASKDPAADEEASEQDRP
jgi:hypothetical protein